MDNLGSFGRPKLELRNCLGLEKPDLKLNATLTVYPDDNVETTSVDGFVEQAYAMGSGQSWATIRGAAGSGNVDSGEAAAGYGPIYAQADNVSNQWIYITRGIYLFDTSTLGAGVTISAATQSIYCSSKLDQLSATPDTNIYASTPASNTDLANGDYAQVGATAWSTAITYAALTTDAYNDYAYNATGLAAISLTSITKTGFRNANRDVANSSPTWASSQRYDLIFKFADAAGTTSDPKLVITYTASTAYSQTFTETAVSLTETIVKASTRILSSTSTLTEAVSHAIARILTESAVTLTDVTIEAIKVIISSFTEATVTVTDNGLTRAITKAFSTTITFTESIIKSITRILTETPLSIVDLGITRAFTKVFSETKTLTETLSRAITRVLTETPASLTETISQAHGFIKEFTESTVTLTSTVVRGLGKTKTETVITLTEAFNKLKNGVNTLWTKVARTTSTWTKQGRQS